MKAYEEEECLNDATVQWNKMKMANIIIQCIQLWFNAVHSLFLANFYFILCFGWNAIYSTKFDFIFAFGWCSRGSSCCTSFDGHLPFRKVHFGKSIYFVPLIFFSPTQSSPTFNIPLLSSLRLLLLPLFAFSTLNSMPFVSSKQYEILLSDARHKRDITIAFLGFGATLKMNYCCQCVVSECRLNSLSSFSVQQ